MLYIMNKVWFRNYQPGQGPWDGRLRYRCTFILIKCLNSIGLNTSLLNLMGMAIDHFMAINKPLLYSTIRKTKKIIIMIAGLWVVAILAGFSDFLSGINIDDMFTAKLNYCELIWLTDYHDEYLTFVLAFLCLGVMLFIYIKICIKIHHRHTGLNIRQHIRQNQNRDNMLNRKPIITTLLIVGSFVLCWLPMCLFQIILIIVVRVNPMVLRKFTTTLQDVDQYLYDLLLLNCIIDPIIYAVRMPEVRLGYQRLFMRCGVYCKIYRQAPNRRGTYREAAHRTTSHCRDFSPLVCNGMMAHDQAKGKKECPQKLLVIQESCV